MDASPVIDVLRGAVPGAMIEPGTATDTPTIYVHRDHAKAVVRALRDDPALQFGFLVDVTAVDYLPADPRFEIVYHLACLGDAFKTAGAATAAPARRLRVKVPVSGGDARVDSLVSLFPGANWPEREVFDLFGIVFEGHPDLRRLLMPDDWQGHPLRKDYPVQIRKDTEGWSPIQLSAEEFAANIREQRERAARLAGKEGS
jgi:NADH-quinone oxidoreductase subunit C